MYEHTVFVINHPEYSGIEKKKEKNRKSIRKKILDKTPHVPNTRLTSKARSGIVHFAHHLSDMCGRIGELHLLVVVLHLLRDGIANYCDAIPNAGTHDRSS